MTVNHSTLVCASANPDKVAEIAALLDGAVELLPRPGVDARRRRGRRHAGRQRPAEGGCDRATRPGCRRSPTTPGSRSTRSTARRVCTPRGTPGADCTYADNRHKLLDAARRDRAIGGPGSARSRWCVWPTGASSPSRVCARARSARANGGVRMGLRRPVRPRRRRRPHVRRDDRCREARDVAPWPRVPRPGRSAHQTT